MWTCRKERYSVMQKLSAASSCWFVEYACMHEETSLKKTLERKNEKSSRHERKLKGNRVESFDEKGIKVYITLKEKSQDPHCMLGSRRRLFAHATSMLT
jgi:hypothetical protein